MVMNTPIVTIATQIVYYLHYRLSVMAHKGVVKAHGLQARHCMVTQSDGTHPYMYMYMYNDG